MNATIQPNNTFDTVPITTKDHVTVIEFLLKFFFRDEPLNVAIKLVEETYSNKDFINYSKGILDNEESCSNFFLKMSEVDKCTYNIVPTTTEDKQIITELLRKFFFRDEPLILGIDMLEDNDSLSKLENYCLKFVDNGLAFKAISSNGDLMGVILSSIMERNDNEKHEEGKQDQKDNTKFKDISTFLDKVEREANVFGKYPNVDRIMDIKIISVDESFRGQGVCKALINKTIELASATGCSMVYVECSSYFSAKAAERLGFQCIYTLYFRDYVDENGEVIFETILPHDSSKVYVLTL